MKKIFEKDEMAYLLIVNIIFFFALIFALFALAFV